MVGGSGRKERLRSRQFEVEADVRAAWENLVNFHRDNILPVLQQGRIDHTFVVGRRFVGPNCGDVGQSIEGNWAIRHGSAKNLRAVEINDRAIIPQYSQLEGTVRGRIRHGYRPPKISSNIMTAVRPGGHYCGFVSIAIAEWGGAACPGAIIVACATPRCAEADSDIKVFPTGSRRDQAHVACVTGKDGDGEGAGGH